jgi:hypothetical protein
MTSNLTPTERAAKTNAMPTHVVYMTRGGGNALITQSFCEVIAESDADVTIESVSGTLTIPRADVFAVKDGRLTDAEMDAVFTAHGAEQNRAH